MATQGLVHELPASKSFVKCTNNANSGTPHKTYRVRSQNLRGVRRVSTCILNKLPPAHTRDVHACGNCELLPSKTTRFHGLGNLRRQSRVGRRNVLKFIVKDVPGADGVVLASVSSDNDYKVCGRGGVVCIYLKAPEGY